MRIDKKLNLVVPIERDEGTLYVHSMPIGAQVFDLYFMPISKAFADIYRMGLDIVAGPRIAVNMLQKVSEEQGVWEGDQGVKNGLLNEIRRLSNLLTPTDKGWASLPLQAAIDSGILSADEVRDVENQITFFTVVSAMNTQKQLSSTLTGLTYLWDALTTSLDSTEYGASLQT